LFFNYVTKRKKLPTLKIKVVEMTASGKSVVQISRDLGISRPTVYRWIKRWKEKQCLDERKRSGPLRSLTVEQVESATSTIQQNPAITANALIKEINVNCSPRSLTKHLNTNGFKSFKAPLKPAHFPCHVE
jgi:transposase